MLANRIKRTSTNLRNLINSMYQVITTGRIRTKGLLNYAILVLVVTLLATFQARAQCGQRDISGYWKLEIVDSAATESMDLKQAGPTVSGRASANGGVDLVDFYGSVTGNVDGDKVHLSVDWTKDKYTMTESFDGAFGPDGGITGKGRVWSLSGNIPVQWKSDRPMKCLYNTVKRLGTKPSNPAGQAQQPPSTSKAPWITAAPNNIALPYGIGVGQTTLIWDGGNDHPYAEVWVKVDGQDETKVLERGKGTLPVVVVPGKTYVYILTDAGTTLATVTVRFLR